MAPFVEPQQNADYRKAGYDEYPAQQGLQCIAKDVLDMLHIGSWAWCGVPTRNQDTIVSDLAKGTRNGKVRRKHLLICTVPQRVRVKASGNQIVNAWHLWDSVVVLTRFLPGNRYLTPTRRRTSAGLVPPSLSDRKAVSDALGPEAADIDVLDTHEKASAARPRLLEADERGQRVLQVQLLFRARGETEDRTVAHLDGRRCPGSKLKK